MGSGLRAAAPRCLGRENAGRTMAAAPSLVRRLFLPNPVYVIFNETAVVDRFFFGFVGHATPDTADRSQMSSFPPPGLHILVAHSVYSARFPR